MPGAGEDGARAGRSSNAGREAVGGGLYDRRMSTPSDLRPLHRTAVTISVDIVSRVRADDLDRPTPCGDWTLRDLLAHMTVQHLGFAAAARGHGGDPGLWDANPDEPDPVGAYATAAADVLDAFAADDVLTAELELPEFAPVTRYPGAQAIGFHFIDYVAHGWDVAATLGVPYEIPDDVAAAVLPLALQVPNGAGRGAPGAAFAAAIESGDGSSDLDRFLLWLGREPAWRP